MDKLNELFSALSGNEKKYIATLLRSFKKDSASSALFNTLSRSGTLLKSSFLQNESGINNVSRMKNYLYDQILVSLRRMQTEKKTLAQIREGISDAETLYRKALYKQCYLLVNDLLIKAEAHEEFEVQMELLRFKMNLLPFTEKEKLASEKKKVIASVQHTSKKIEELNAAMLLSMETDYIVRHAENSEKKQGVQKIKYRLKALKNSHSPRVLALIYLSESQLSFHERDLTKAIKSSSALQELFSKHPKMIKENADFYVSAVYNNLVCHYTLGRYTEAFVLLQKLQQFSPGGASEKINMRVRQKVIARTLPLELALFYSVGKFKEGVELLRLKKTELTWYFDNIEKTRRLETGVSMSYLYFGAGDYKKSAAWCKRFTNELKEEGENEYYLSFHLIYLMGLYEQNDFTEIKKQLKSLKKQNIKENVLIEFFSQLGASESTGRERWKIFKTFTEDENKMVKLASFFNGLSWWIKARALRKNVALYLKENGPI